MLFIAIGEEIKRLEEVQDQIQDRIFEARHAMKKKDISKMVQSYTKLKSIKADFDVVEEGV